MEATTHPRELRELICGPAVLFAPANRPEIFPKAAAAADMVILDLEDGAGETDRAQARANILGAKLDPARTIVRVCGPEDPDFAGDIEMVRRSPYQLVMIPKVGAVVPPATENGDDLSGLQLIAMVETPQAVLNLGAIAADPRVVGLFWGAEDLTALLGGTHSRLQTDEGAPAGELGTYRDTMRLTRALMHLHASAHGKFTLDAVNADFSNLNSLAAEARDACRMGMAGTCVIHPKQVETVRQAYRPDAAAIDWAQQVVAAAAAHEGAFQLAGEMVDAPLIAQARRTLQRAGL